MSRRPRLSPREAQKILRKRLKQFGSIEAMIADADERERQEAAKRRSADLKMLRPDGRVIVFRSKWERRFAQFLDENGIRWEYEPATCIVDGRRYTPDFLVDTPTGKRFIELHVMYRFEERYGESATKRARAFGAVLEQLGHPLVILDEDTYPRSWR